MQPWVGPLRCHPKNKEWDPQNAEWAAILIYARAGTKWKTKCVCSDQARAAERQKKQRLGGVFYMTPAMRKRSNLSRSTKNQFGPYEVFLSVTYLTQNPFFAAAKNYRRVDKRKTLQRVAQNNF